MKLSSLILKNFYKNLKNYGLYIFSLIFSVALYFSLVLLSMDEAAQDTIAEDTGMSAMFIVGAVLTLIIIATFVCFANFIFIKRRHKELALFQLIGMNRAKVFRILALENSVIYFGSLIAGIALGFLGSRLLMLILLQMMQVDMAVEIIFSGEAVIQTALVFIVIFIILMIQNYIFLRSKRLIDLLELNRTTELKTRKAGIGTILLGITGIIMVAAGYYLSTLLFDSAMQNPIMLFIMMPLILFLTIAGTYITFKTSVQFILNIIRAGKNGHVNINDVLSITSIMFKMRSNAFLLTVITTLTALSISLMSLTYISYYSIESQSESLYTFDYVVTDDESLEYYEELLSGHGYDITDQSKQFMHYDIENSGAVSLESGEETEEGDALSSDDPAPRLVVISDEEIDSMDVGENEGYITGDMNVITEMAMEITPGEPMTFSGDDFERTVEVVEVEEDSVLPNRSTFGLPTAVVDDEVYQELAEHQPADFDDTYPSEVHAFDITGGDDEDVLNIMDEEEHPSFTSKQMSRTTMIQSSGLTMFIIGFVGFSFLLTSGCILYFKQIGECEDEKESYKVLRKLGFNEGEIIRGLSLKMLITFGVPLIIGLCHTFFAVRSGWFIFGTEMWAPMLTVIGIYTLLYSIFGLMSLGYYRKVVRESI